MSNLSQTESLGRRDVVGLRSRVILGLLVATIAVVFYPTWWSMVAKWYTDSGTYSHGVLVVAASLVLMASVAKRIAQRASFRELVLFNVGVLVATSVWSIGYLTNVQFVQASVLPIVLLFAISAVFGIRVFWAMLFPCLYILFAVPIWEVFTEPLQNMTIAVVGYFLSAVRIPALIQGELVHIPSGTFQIATGCAGLHFFIVAFALGTLYAYVSFRSYRRRGIFVVLVLAVAIVMNWIRVGVIITAGYATEMKHYLVAVDHYYFGWLLFAVMMVPIGIIGYRMQSADMRHHDEPDEQSISVEKTGSNNSMATFAITLAIVMAGPMATYALVGYGDQLDRPPLEVPSVIDGWNYSDKSTVPWNTRYPGAAEELTGSYANDAFAIDIYVNRYVKQSQGSELISHANQLYDRSNSRIVDARQESIETEDGSRMNIHVVEVLGSGSGRELYAHWYQVGNKVTIIQRDAKIFELLSRLRGKPGSGIVALRLACTDNCDNERQSLLGFIANAATRIGKSVPGLQGANSVGMR